MRYIRIFVLCFVLFSAAAMAHSEPEPVVLRDGAPAWDLTILEADFERTVLRLDLYHFDVKQVSIDGADFQIPTLEESPQLSQRGRPDLPTIRESLHIPDSAAMSVRVLDAEYREFSGQPVAPSKGILPRSVDLSQIPYTFADCYGHSEWFPAATAELGEPYIMRDTRGVVLALNPMQYNPVSQILRVAMSLTVEVYANGSDGRNVLANKPERPASEFEKLYARHYLNWPATAGGRYETVAETGSMIVICYDAFRSVIQPFVDWKNQMGIPTSVVDVSTIGADGTQIKAYIQTLYNFSGVCFIVLVGDAAQVPYFEFEGASDPSYALLAGDDVYPDAFVGRLSAENPTELQTQVERIIAYEREPQVLADWYHQGVGIGSSDGPFEDDDEYDWEHIDVIRDKLLGFTFSEVDQIYDPEASISMVATAVNEGRSIINYCGHGGPQGWGTSGFNNEAVDQLTNINMLPFITSVACNTGEFHTGTCLAEAWLRATHNGQPTGGIGMYASTIGMTGAPPMSAQDEFVDLLVDEVKRCFGALCFLGACQMIDDYGVGIGEVEYRHWTVFGDPSLQVRTDTPVAAAAQHAPVLTVSAGQFQVSTNPENLAALSYQGELLGRTFAGEDGLAVISLTGELPDVGDSIRLTITGFNRQTYETEILIVDDLIPTCLVSPGELNLVLGPEQIVSESLEITNSGEPGSTLYYFVHLEDPDYPRERFNTMRDMNGSYAWCDLDFYLPGENRDVEFRLYNGSDDGDYVRRFTMDLPPGVVLETLPGHITGGYDGPIPYVGEIGDGAFCDWETPGESGSIFPGQIGVVTLNLTFADVTSDVVIPYVIYGDQWGGPPYEVSGEIVIARQPPGVTVISPDGGETWAVGESQAIEFTGEGGPEFVRIELNRSGGASGHWESLAEMVPLAGGSFSWTVTTPLSAHCVIRVSDADDPAVADVSDGSFTIFREMSWVTVSQDQGSVPVGETETLMVTFDATGLPVGQYLAELYIYSNAGEPVVVPITVEVVVDPMAASEIDTSPGLSRSYPNPSNRRAVIAYGLPEAGSVRLGIYDLAGRRVRVLIDGVQSAGAYEAVWDGNGDDGVRLAAGCYFSRLEAVGQTRRQKILLVR
jgi:Peptidase family C25/Propeptide_C25/FlgD Ig-like domain/Peptidase family C25, C terminal ig-like domain